MRDLAPWIGLPILHQQVASDCHQGTSPCALQYMTRSAEYSAVPAAQGRCNTPSEQMFEVFDFHSRTKIRRDSRQVTRDLVHDKHDVSAAATAQQAAQEYLRRFHAHLGMKLEELKSLHLPWERDP